jgi:hypothetical protein
MSDHGWTTYFADGHAVAFAASECEACSGALRAVNDNGEVVILIRNWTIAIRDDVADAVTITPAPESSSGRGDFTGRPFA